MCRWIVKINTKLKRSRGDGINKFYRSVATLKTLWMAAASHMCSFNQLKYFIYDFDAQVHKTVSE